MELMEVDNLYNSDRPRQHGHFCSYLKPCTAILIAVIALLGGFIGGIVYHKHSIQSNQPLTPGTIVGHTEGQFGDVELNTHLVDLRINPESPCDGSSCILCTTQISSKKTELTPEGIPRQPYDCPDHEQVKNGTCFECDSQCYTMETLEQTPPRTCGRRRPRIDCCLFAIMGNLTEFCGPGGRYNCYNFGNILNGICDCPLGKKGDRCQETAQETVPCSCWKGGYKFCGEEWMDRCNTENTSSGWSKCQINIDQLNCVCRKEHATEGMRQCSMPQTDAQTNSATDAHHFVSGATDTHLTLYVLLLAVMLAYVLDKT